MTSFLLLGDLHLSDKPPASCTESYTDDLFDILDYTVRLAEEYDAVVIQAGDLFHLKAPGHNSHALVQRTIEVIQKYPKGFWVVPGNHDLQNDRLQSVMETQPLGVVLRAGAKLLSGWMSPFQRVYGVPWLQRFDDVSVAEALKDYRQVNAGNSRLSLVVTHAPLYPPSLELPYEYYPAENWADYMGNSGAAYYGHVHEAHGFWSTGGVKFANAGALSRGSLHEHNLTRELAVTLWNDLNGEFARLEVPHKPAEEVFRIAEAAAKKRAQVELDGFLASVGKASIEITSVSSVLDYVRTLGLPEDVILVIKELLDA